MEKPKEITKEEHSLICKIFEVEHPANLGEITIKRLVILMREAKKELWSDLKDMSKSGLNPVTPNIENQMWKYEVKWLKKKHNLKRE